MIKKTLQVLALLGCLFMGTSCATAQKSSGLDLRSGASTLGNLIEGVFSTSKIDIEDLAGEWTANGSAVKFKSENFLNKAGGLAAAAAIETKLDPYYDKLGLNGAVITIQTDGSFKMTVKKINLSGQITKLDNGNFNFNFKILGGMSIGNIETYISKTSNQTDVMFDADKLIKLIEMVGKVSGLKTVNAVSDILKSYDGICVGFKMKKTGSVEGEKKTLGGALNDLFGGKKTGSDSQQTTAPAQEENTQQSTGGSLLDLLKKKK